MKENGIVDCFGVLKNAIGDAVSVGMNFNKLI